MHFWSHTFCTIARLPFLVLKYAVARCVSCLSAVVSAYTQIHITRALYANHAAWWVHNFPRLQRSKFWLNMVSFVLLKKIYFSCYIKQIMNVFSFVQWNKYFHEVKDEMFHSTRRIALINIHYLYNMSYKDVLRITDYSFELSVYSSFIVFSISDSQYFIDSTGDKKVF